MRYTVVLDADEEGRGYTVTVPALPGCITEGRTREEALANAQEAIHCYIESLRMEGQPVPVEEPPVEVTSVELAVVA